MARQSAEVAEYKHGAEVAERDASGKALRMIGTNWDIRN
jgi:hypothetical protein